MRDWFWWTQRGLSSGGGGNGGQTAPQFPTDAITSIEWQGKVTGNKVLQFQPCDGPCGCQGWLDTFPGPALDSRWRVEAGEWAVAGVLTSTTPGATMTAQTLADPGCTPLDVYRIVAEGVEFGAGERLRIYFDWLDEDHCQWVEFEHGAAFTESAGCQQGGTASCQSATVTIYRRDGGDAEVIAGPEHNPFSTVGWYRYIAVDVAQVGEEGQLHVYVHETHMQVRADRMGTRCGIGKSPDDTPGSQLSIEQFSAGNCNREAVNAMGYGWGWAAAAGVQVVSGSISAGSLTSLVDPFAPLLQVSPDEDGAADVIVPVRFAASDRDPRVINAMAWLTGASSDAALGWAVWNFTDKRWEKTLNDGTLTRPLAPSLPGYAITAVITREHMNADGFAAIRLWGTSTGAWTLDVRHVVGWRDANTPENVNFLLTFGTGWDSRVDGQTFELEYQRGCGTFCHQYGNWGWGTSPMLMTEGPIRWHYHNADSSIWITMDIGLGTLTWTSEDTQNPAFYAAICRLSCWLTPANVGSVRYSNFVASPPYRPLDLDNMEAEWSHFLVGVSNVYEITDGSPISRVPIAISAIRQ